MERSKCWHNVETWSRYIYQETIKSGDDGTIGYAPLRLGARWRSPVLRAARRARDGVLRLWSVVTPLAIRQITGSRPRTSARCQLWLLRPSRVPRSRFLPQTYKWSRIGSQCVSFTLKVQDSDHENIPHTEASPRYHPLHRATQ